MALLKVVRDLKEKNGSIGAIDAACTTIRPLTGSRRLDRRVCRRRCRIHKEVSDTYSIITDRVRRAMALGEDKSLLRQDDPHWDAGVEMAVHGKLQ
jgi:hypothetical protein